MGVSRLERCTGATTKGPDRGRCSRPWTRTRNSTEPTMTISVRHVKHDGWDEVEHTVLHEMVHQWQAESGHEIDHGPTFRRKAMEVGVFPRADRMVGPRVAACAY